MTYLFEYDGGIPAVGASLADRPRWVKTITDSDGVEQRIILNLGNTEERASLTAQEVYVHLNNLVFYIKDVSQGVSPIALGEDGPSDGWHFNGGWAEIEWAKDEVLRWWESVYYKDEEEPA